MLWAECEGERRGEAKWCGERCVVGERWGLGGRVSWADSKPVWSSEVAVGERPMGVGRGTSSVDMLSKVTRGTERERCLKGGGVGGRSWSSRRSYDGRFCSCRWNATMSSSQSVRSSRDWAMLGVDPEELIWSWTDLDLFLCRLENLKLLFWKNEGEPEGVVPLEELLMELWESAALRREGRSCCSVTLTSLVLMAARVSLSLRPDPGPDSALPGVDAFLWWCLDGASSLLARSTAGDTRLLSTCSGGAGSSGQASAKSRVRLTRRLLRSVEASVSDEEVRDRARKTSEE